MNAHPLASTSTTLSILLIFPLYFGNALFAQNTFHVFTDKKGKAIEATPLLVTPDKTKLGIQRKDGRKFEIPILTLSLDDQQFIKEWLKDNPIKMDFNLEITFTKHIEDTDKVSRPQYNVKFITEETNFKIEVKNRSRLRLTGATLEYYVITEHSVGKGRLSSNNQEGADWWFYPFNSFSSNRGDGQRGEVEKPISLANGKAQIEDLPFNFTAEIITDTIPVREIYYTESRDKLKDTILGVIVRITDENGNELGVESSPGAHKLIKQGWEKVSHMPPGDPSGFPSRQRNN